MEAICVRESSLAQRVIEGLQQIHGVRIYGITDPDRANERLPVVSFTLEGISATEVARRLGDEALFLWSGDFYAVNVVDRLGLAGVGGLVRIGINHYNTTEEVDRLLDAVARIAA